jgi:hypothetical protein
MAWLCGIDCNVTCLCDENLSREIEWTQKKVAELAAEKKRREEERAKSAGNRIASNGCFFGRHCQRYTSFDGVDMIVRGFRPAALADAIDKAVADAVAAEREACAKFLDKIGYEVSAHAIRNRK